MSKRTLLLGYLFLALLAVAGVQLLFMLGSILLVWLEIVRVGWTPLPPVGFAIVVAAFLTAKIACRWSSLFDRRAELDELPEKG